MKRFMPAAVAMLVFLFIATAIAGDKAKAAYAKGQDAEARENYEAAYDFYKQAFDLKPKDCRKRWQHSKRRR